MPLIRRSTLERLIRRAERAEDRLDAVLDALAEHRQGDMVPVGPVLAALVISRRRPSTADIERGREIERMTNDGQRQTEGSGSPGA